MREVFHISTTSPSSQAHQPFTMAALLDDKECTRRTEDLQVTVLTENVASYTITTQQLATPCTQQASWVTNTMTQDRQLPQRQWFYNEHVKLTASFLTRTMGIRPPKHLSTILATAVSTSLPLPCWAGCSLQPWPGGCSFGSSGKIAQQ